MSRMFKLGLPHTVTGKSTQDQDQEVRRRFTHYVSEYIKNNSLKYRINADMNAILVRFCLLFYSFNYLVIFLAHR
jgi:hypothetical protein